MKRYFPLLVALLSLTLCTPKEKKASVTAREVPERKDDFMWENDFFIYRAYGKALEKEMVTPGFDIWVKNVPDLVADKRYEDDTKRHISFHEDHGDGMDRYQVGVSLGGGASCPVVRGKMVFPATNYRSVSILEKTPEKVVFTLHYPSWKIDSLEISLDKTITVEKGVRFCKCEDLYKFSGSDSLAIAAGAVCHSPDALMRGDSGDRIAIWERFSEEGAKEEDGRIGIAVVLPGADSTASMNHAGSEHLVCLKGIRSGEPLTYYFSSAWSKSDISTSDGWFAVVRAFTER